MECAPPTDRGQLGPLLRRPGWVLAAFVLLALAAAPGLLRLRIDNSAEGFFVRDAAALDAFWNLEYHFGRDRAVRIVLSGPSLWTREGLAWLAELERRSQDEIRGVLGSAGLYRHHRWHLPAWPPPDPAAFRDAVVADPVDRAAGWVSADGSTATILVGLFRLAPEQRREALTALEALIADPPPGVDARLTGLPVVNRTLDEAVVRMAKRCFPALLLVAVALLAAVFRSVSGVLLPLTLVAVCQTVVLGAMGLTGQRLDLITVILVPLLFVIALATAVHVLAHQRRMRGATLATYRVKAWPVLWTGVTTAVGFGSLALSGVPPVRALGLWAAFAMAFLTLAMLSFYPALLAATEGGKTAGAGRSVAGRLERWADATGRRLAAASVSRRQAVFVLFGVLAAAAAAGLAQLHFQTDVLRLFPEDAPVRTRIAALEERGVGTASASLVIRRSETGDRTGENPGAAPGPDSGLKSADALRELARLAAELRREPLVLGALSAGDLVTDVATRLPEDEAPGANFPAGALDRIDREDDLERMLGYLATDDGERARITLLLPMRGYRELQPLFDRALSAGRRAFPDAEVTLTGQYPLVLSAQRFLLRTMVISLTATAACVALALVFALGSVSLTLRALVPNLWPVLFVLGAMGWTGVPVDSATVMVASVVLGLAVDDTLHSLGSFRRLVARSSAPEAAALTLGETAGAHALTSLILAVGFGLVGLSELVPVARFGALASIAILAALAADLTLVPALLAGTPRAALARLRRRSGSTG